MENYFGSVSVLRNADGSAMWQMKQHGSVVASVNGPLESRAALGNIEVIVPGAKPVTTDVQFRSRHGNLPLGNANSKSGDDLSVEAAIRSVYEQALAVDTLSFVRTRYEINVQEACGLRDAPMPSWATSQMLLSVAMNSVCLALLDGACPMRYSVAATTCYLLAAPKSDTEKGNSKDTTKRRRERQVLLDCELTDDLMAELERMSNTDRACVCVAVRNNSTSQHDVDIAKKDEDEIVFIRSDGLVSPREINACVARALQNAESIFSKYLDVVKARASKQAYT